MSRIFRRLLLYILIATLPLQGMATAVVGCNVASHQAQVTQDAMSAHHHDMQMNMDSHTDVPASADIHKAGNHAGSNCASCCTGVAALLNIVLAAPADFDSQPALATPAPFFSSTFPSGLERPPKHSLS